MFSRLAHMVVHNPWKVISAWVIALVVFTLVSPSLSDVVNSYRPNNQGRTVG